MDYSGKEILSCAYSKILPEKDFIRIENFNRQSIRSYEGKELVPYFYAIYPLNVKGKFIFEVGKKESKHEEILYGLHSPEFGKIVSAKYSKLEVLQDGTIIFCQDGQYGLAKYSETCHSIFEIMYGYSYMRFNLTGHNQYIIARKRFKYAVYDKEGHQIKKFRYRCFIPKKDLWMYDNFEWLS